MSASSLQLDRKVRFHLPAKAAIALKILRDQFAAAMSIKMRGKSLSPLQERWFALALEYLASGVHDEPSGAPSIG
jgi:ATP-dependent RNA helicase DHX29